MSQNKISVDYLKENFDETLRRVEAGESFTVFSGEISVVDLIPARISRKLEIRVTIESILRSKKHSISNQELEPLKTDGRC